MATDREGDVRPLHFIDHGDEFHEQLCAAFLNLADTALVRDRVPVASVGYPPGHSALSDLRPLLVTAAACSLSLPTDDDARWDGLMDGLNSQDARHLRRYGRAASQADDRWLRLAAPTRLILEGLAINPEGGDLERLPASHVTAFLDPRAETGSLVVRDPVSLPDTIPRLRDAALRRRAKAHAIKPHLPDPGQVTRRSELVTAEAYRVQSEAQARAATFRAQMSSDERQARIAEARATRVEREAEALGAFASRRVERIVGEEKLVNTRVWQVILIPFERN